VTSKACGEAPDGGPYDSTAGYGNALLACRVQADATNASGGSLPPACAPAGAAGDGSWCKSSAECAPTYDCVGAGTCQRYCCRGNVECLADQFCDIQQTAAASSVKIPVCMPVHPTDRRLPAARSAGVPAIGDVRGRPRGRRHQLRRGGRREGGRRVRVGPLRGGPRVPGHARRAALLPAVPHGEHGERQRVLDDAAAAVQGRLAALPGSVRRHLRVNGEMGA
jgi:hypothetical protein